MVRWMLRKRILDIGPGIDYNIICFSVLSVIQPFADVIGNYTCQDRKKDAIITPTSPLLAEGSGSDISTKDPGSRYFQGLFVTPLTTPALWCIIKIEKIPRDKEEPT